MKPRRAPPAGHLTAMRNKTRRSTVLGAAYVWRVSHRHRMQDRCTEVFTAYAAGCRRGLLRIFFDAGAGGGPELIERLGLIATSVGCVNLNRPQTAAALITHALASGWSAGSEDLVVENGFQFLSNLPAEVRAAITER